MNDLTPSLNQTPAPPAPANPAPMPPGVEPTPATPQAKPDNHILVIAASVIVILILILAIIALAIQGKNNSGQITVTTTPTLGPLPTSVPNRPLSAIATQNAFLEFERQVTALSATLNSTNTTDVSLTPPVIELSLGF